MRIFYASDTTAVPPVQSNVWRNNLYLSLRALGHDVVEFEYDFGETFRNLDPSIPAQAAFIRENRPRLTRELLRQVRAAHAARPIDLFFSYFYDACVLPEAIDEIRSLGIVAVNWYCNASYQLHLVREIAPHYDWCLVPEKFRLPDYEALGAHPIYCQEAANPDIYRPYDVPISYDVSFVGQSYGDRPAYVRFLLDHGVDVHAFGPGWERLRASAAPPRQAHPLRRLGHIARRLSTLDGWRRAFERLTGSAASAPAPVIPDANAGPPLSDEEMILLYSRSKINLGFSTCGETHRSQERIVQIRLRDFEIPMSGGFYLVEHMDELAEFFEIGKEIACYRDRDDLLDKIRYYLAHDAERDAIRRAGRERCLRDHTWQRRFQDAFRQMGLSGRGSASP